MDLSFFNPRSQSEADFIASFVARASTLEFFLRQLRQLGPDEAARHQLIVAPRGFGKTSLLRRIAIAVRADADMRQRYLPLSFREEQHNVISLDVFWRNCLQSLLEAREEEQASEEELNAIDKAWAQLSPRQSLPRDAQDGDPAWQELSLRCMQLGRRPLLLIDNLDTLLAGLGKDHQWSLRQTLQRADGPVVIAAASRYPESTHDRDAAFYDFFHIQTLNRLENAEVLLCLRTLAHHRGEAGKPVLKLLDSDPGRVAALNTLAGGNPRTLGVLYGVLESHMSTDVLSQLSAMLDTFTGWYQARTEELPMQARAVFDALALNWDPMTAAAVGQTTGLETTAVSSQLSRLEKLGYVESVALSRRGKGRSGFQVVERFFNIWYLMRNGPRRARQSIKFLTVFLQSCFSAPERRSLGRQVLDVECADPGYALALAATFRDGPLRERLLQRADSATSQSPAAEDYQALIRSLQPRTSRATDRSSAPSTRPLAPEAPLKFGDRPEPSPRDTAHQPGKQTEPEAALRHGHDLLKQDRIAEALEVFEGLLRRWGKASDPAALRVSARTLLSKAVALGQLGRSDEEIAAYDSILSRFGEASEMALRKQVARALINKGLTLGELGRAEEEMAVYDSILSRFGEASELPLREGVAQALINKGLTLGELGRAEEEMAVYDSILSRFGEASELPLREGVAQALINKGLTLGELGRAEEEMAVYDSILSRFGEASELPLREQLARALVNKGITLGQMGRAEEERTVYDSILSRFGEASEMPLREGVAQALINKGITLGQLGRSDEAIATYDSVLSRLGEASELPLREQLARALVNKGITLGQLGRSDEAIATYDCVLSRFGEASELPLREGIAQALVNKGLTLGQLGRSDEAIATYDCVLSRLGEASELPLREQLARALVNKGITLGQLGRSDEAIATYDCVLSRFGEASELALRKQVARALINKGLTLGELGRAEEEMAVYDSILSRFDEASELQLREQLARALVNKGITLGQLGRSDEAIAACDSVLSRFGEASEMALRKQVARALINKGLTLGELGRAEEEMAVYDSILSRFGEASELQLREGVAQALVNKGITLGQLGRSDEAIAAYDSVLSRFGEASELPLREGVARALVNKGVVLGQLGRNEEEIAVCDSVVNRYGEANELALNAQVARALINKGLTLGELGRNEEEIAVYDSVVSRYGEANELALSAQVARALVNKGLTLGELGRGKEEMAVYERVVSLYGEATELDLLKQVVRAECGKADALLDSGQSEQAEAVLRSGLKRRPGTADLWNSLGNLLLDSKGDPAAAETAFLQGLSVADDDGTLALLHANCAYVLALHLGDHPRAQDHIQRAVATEKGGLTDSGRYLLASLPKSSHPDELDWSAMFAGIGRAVDSGDAALWTDYLDDLQRLLWFVIAHKQGDRLREWMVAEDYPLRQSPLYHAVVAAIEGEDHLLQINPETRAAAMRIFQGLARRLQLYAKGSEKRPRGRTSRAGLSAAKD